MKKLDLVGKRFGKLVVIDEAESTQRGQAMWKCKCDCGNICTVLGMNLRSGHSTSCGCSRTNDLTGRKIGKLTVLCRSDVRVPRGKRTSPTWKCKCDCGEIVYRPTDILTNGDYHSCQRCMEMSVSEVARRNAGFIDGTQLSKIKNMGPPSTNSSGVRGVYYDRRTGKWRARLKFKRKLMNFGSYDRFEDAVEARKKAEEEYYGSFLEEHKEIDTQ